MFAFYSLGLHLRSFGYLEYFDEISNNIMIALATSGVHSWSTVELASWIKKLKFLGTESTSIASVIIAEMIDGYSFMKITENQWTKHLHLSLESFVLLSYVRDGWQSAWGEPISVPEGACAAVACQLATDLRVCSSELASSLIHSDRLSSESGVGLYYGQLVVLGCKEYHLNQSGWQPMGVNNEKFVLKRKSVANGIRLRHSSDDCSCQYGDQTNNATNKSCSSSGTSLDDDAVLEGTVMNSVTITSGAYRTYPFDGLKGSAPALNRQCVRWSQHSPYRDEDCASTDVPKADGIDAASQWTMTIDYVSDPTKDIFQIGRSDEAGANDFVCKGPVHDTFNGFSCGTVSRVACRIECDRLPPYKSYIYANGFNASKKLVMQDGSRCWIESSSPGNQNMTGRVYQATSLQTNVNPIFADGFSTFGVRLWNPITKIWSEITIMGRACKLRSSKNDLSEFFHPLEASNELVDGSIIDICGVSLLFQSPISMAKQLQATSPKEVIQSINSLKPLCPVLMHNIKFAYLTPHQRARRATLRLQSSELNYTARGLFYIPPVDYSEISEEHRPYVFPACGHVHAFHRSLVGRPCPLCRQQGDFVPIAFAFEPSICHGKPTHVFNPCGHAASKQTCEYWSSVGLLGLGPFNTSPFACCPFCLCPLSDASNGGPFNRLILQTESGLDWLPDLNCGDVLEREVCGTELRQATNLGSKSRNNAKRTYEENVDDLSDDSVVVVESVCRLDHERKLIDPLEYVNASQLLYHKEFDCSMSPIVRNNPTTEERVNSGLYGCNMKHDLSFPSFAPQVKLEDIIRLN